MSTARFPCKRFVTCTQVLLLLGEINTTNNSIFPMSINLCFYLKKIADIMFKVKFSLHFKMTFNSSPRPPHNVSAYRLRVNGVSPITVRYRQKDISGQSRGRIGERDTLEMH